MNGVVDASQVVYFLTNSGSKLSSHGPLCLFLLFLVTVFTMAGAPLVSDSENSDTGSKAKVQAESVKNDAESEGEEGASEFEIEEVLDAKRGYFPEVRPAN